MMNGAYQLKNYEATKKHGAQAIIPLNLRNEKEPPAIYLKRNYLFFHGV